MREMVGGCCVCSDEHGWQDNPLVYCDGRGCAVAVHQACYGIQCVPSGPWYCEKCATGEPSNKLRCDLCPMKEGALKRTDKHGWAHVICALYIPEIQFGNVDRMDPVLVSLTPLDRYNKVCYICEEKGSSEMARMGACMQCNKAGCKVYFHVTCGQQEGLLCEESGNKSNIKYCGYCSQHFKKLNSSRGGRTTSFVSAVDERTERRSDPNLKIIPAYRPVIPLADVSTAPSANFGIKQNPIHNGNVGTVNGDDRYKRTVENSVGTLSNLATTALSSVPSASPSAPAGNSHPQQPSAVSTSTVFLSQSIPGTPHFSTLVRPLPTTSNMVSSAWSTPGPRISYLGFNNDLLHSVSSGAVGSSAESTAARGESALSNLASIAAIPNVMVTGLNAAVNETSKQTASNSAFTQPPPPPTSTPSGDLATSMKNGKSAGSNKRKLESKGQEGEQVADKSKKPRRSSKKTVKNLLDLVTPMVEDTVTSFQMEKIASQQNEPNQQELLEQHQQSSIDSVIAATAAGQQSQGAAINLAERTMVTAPPPAASAADRVGEASIAGPISALQAPLQLPPRPASFRSPPEPSSLSVVPSFPMSLEQLLERQWEQGSQFLMEQAPHFDIASLLSCLNQLKMENQRLEDHVVSLSTRRDHLLTVNARLSATLNQSPNSPRISAALSATTPFHHSHSLNTQDGPQDACENSGVSRLSVPPNTSSTATALHHPVASLSHLPVATSTKTLQTPAMAVSTNVISPTNRSTLGSSAHTAVLTNLAAMAASPSLTGGVFLTVKNKSAHETSPAERQQPAPGSFLMPRAPTPILATDLVRPVSNQYTVNQDPNNRVLYSYQLMQQNAIAAAAAYGNAISSLIQPMSPHRAAAAVLTQSHLGPHVGVLPAQEKM